MSEETIDRQKVLIDYLTEFDSATRFGKCAGRTARLSLLHENKVSSHALQIHVWYHILNSFNAIIEIGDELELNKIDHFGELSLNEICHILEVEAESDSDFFKMYDTSIWGARPTLSKIELEEHMPVRESLCTLIAEIENLEITNIWAKLNSFYQWEKTDDQIPLLIKSLSDSTGVDEEARVNLNRKIESMKDPVTMSSLKSLKDTIYKFKRKQYRLDFQDYRKHLGQYVADPHFFDGNPLKIKQFVPTLDGPFLKDGHYDLFNAVESKGSNLITIFGNPGFGKTIQLRQFAHNFTEKQFDNIEDIDSVIIPVFVKANILAKNIDKIATVPYAVDMGEETFNGKSVSSTDELLQILIDSAVESDSQISKETISEALKEWDLSRILVLIDAYDECQSSEDRMQILNVIADDFWESGMTVITTCRNSHQPEFIEKFSYLGAEEIVQLDVSFTTSELKEIMPRKLANAWGIGGDDIAYQVEHKFKEYEEVLTHPLFVGLFCLLLDDGRLEQIDNEIMESIDLNIKEGEMGLKHIKFLMQVIDIGLDINISERNSKPMSKNRSDKLRTAFCHMAAASHIYQITQIDLIFDFIKMGMKIELDKEDKKILTENLGIIYATDGQTIDWSHPTIPEVATGMLFAQDNTYSKLFKTQDGHGMMSDIWSECLVLTMASYGREINQRIDLFKPIHSSLQKFDYRSTLKTLRMLDHIETPIFSDLQYNSESGKLTPQYFDGLDEVHTDLGKRYIEAANSGNAFPLPLHAFELNKNIISVDTRYRTEYNRAPIIHYRQPSPISIIDTDAIVPLFEQSNKAHVVKKIIRTIDIYARYYTSQEIEKFINHLSDIIRNNNFGKYELKNGSWLQIIETVIEQNDGLYYELYNALIEKMFQTNTCEKLNGTDFIEDYETQDFIKNNFPTICGKIYGENPDPKLLAVVSEAISEGLISCLGSIYYGGTKARRGWIKDHFMFRQVFGEFVNKVIGQGYGGRVFRRAAEEGYTAEEMQVEGSFMEFLIRIIAISEQEWILPKILADSNLWRKVRTNPWKLD